MRGQPAVSWTAVHHVGCDPAPARHDQSTAVSARARQSCR